MVMVACFYFIIFILLPLFYFCVCVFMCVYFAVHFCAASCVINDDDDDDNDDDNYMYRPNKPIDVQVSFKTKNQN